MTPMLQVLDLDDIAISPDGKTMVAAEDIASTASHARSGSSTVVREVARKSGAQRR